MDEIANTFPSFHDYLLQHWIPVADMFMGHCRRTLLHIDNHTNNRLER